MYIMHTETFYHFGDNDRERWDSLFSLYHLPPFQLPDKEPVLSFGLAGTVRAMNMNMVPSHNHISCVCLHIETYS